MCVSIYLFYLFVLFVLFILKCLKCLNCPKLNCCSVVVGAAGRGEGLSSGTKGSLIPVPKNLRT